MKLVGTLPERVGFLHAVPIFDLFALLLVALLLGQSFMSQSGVQVELPVSRYQIARLSDASTITLTPGNPPVLWLEREQVSEKELLERLKQIRAETSGIPNVCIRSDQSISSEYERRVAEEALQAGFRVYLVGKSLGKE
ncbi:hypothetical protein HAHE_35050 [Haloferula helveola]|uniref:Biopolymer transport protein ExbD/TolR n=1 Tax=Haloferula helveola TaxID=490095 RepID=A0ABN6HAP4_9BACT|nr:hypothetical protein HAHE_35050 [Haloferula helveola]